MSLLGFGYKSKPSAPSDPSSIASVAPSSTGATAKHVEMPSEPARQPTSVQTLRLRSKSVHAQTMSLSSLVKRAHLPLFLPIEPSAVSMLTLAASEFRVEQFAPADGQLPSSSSSASASVPVTLPASDLARDLPTSTEDSSDGGASTSRSSSSSSSSSSRSSTTDQAGASLDSQHSQPSIGLETVSSAFAGLSLGSKPAMTSSSSSKPAGKASKSNSRPHPCTLISQVHRSIHLAAQLSTNDETLRLNEAVYADDPVDVSVRDIQKHGLPALLMSSLPLCFFIGHLLQEQTIENLFFLIDVEAFAGTEFGSAEMCQNAAQDLYALYMSSDSVFELNVTHQIRRQVVAGIRQGRRSCFEPAFEHVAELLQDAFGRFQHGTTLVVQGALTAAGTPHNAHSLAGGLGTSAGLLGIKLVRGTGHAPVKDIRGTPLSKSLSWWKLMAECLGRINVLHNYATATEALHYVQLVLPKPAAIEHDRLFPVLAIRARLDMLLEQRLLRYCFEDNSDE
ncbi:hypothetical protein BC831DRAFT_422013 [Entophlyctis helioformis]|nr:hypothetical protein BC831DRAFT_422013 [Entophlyctis helioformis]